MTRFTVALSVMLALAAGPVAAQEPVHGPPLQAVLDSARARLGAPGAAAAVVFSDGLTWSGASGIAGPGEAATPATAFELGSVTKTYTAVLVLQLIAEGHLALADKLERWYPEIAGAEAITIEMLLNHTHGLHDPSQEPDHVPAILQNPAREWTPEDLLARMREPHFEPGTSWRYSNTGYHLLGRIAERLTASSLGPLLRERVFEPFTLGATWYAAAERPAAHTAAAFIDVNGDGSPAPVSRLIPWTAFLTSAGAAGSIVATASDAARWLHALVTGEVLAEQAWSWMTTWVDRPDGNRYGLGLLSVERADGPLLGHRGNSAGFSAAVFHDPAAGITVAVLTNAHAVDVTPAVIALLEAASSHDARAGAR